jgi:hypothetical protein
METNEFNNVIRDMPLKLFEYGYQILTNESIYSVDLGKMVTLGVFCIVRFQPVHVPEIDMFKVVLIRRRAENFPLGETNYKPLYMDLLNLIMGFYKKKIFPSKQYAWKFSDDRNLVEQITNIQSIIINYGIKWLEDPTSNLDWVGRHRPSPKAQA